MDVVRVAIPLVIFLCNNVFLMFFSQENGADYRDATALSFTASGNNLN